MSKSQVMSMMGLEEGKGVVSGDCLCGVNETVKLECNHQLIGSKCTMLHRHIMFLTALRSRDRARNFSHQTFTSGVSFAGRVEGFDGQARTVPILKSRMRISSLNLHSLALNGGSRRRESLRSFF